MLGALVVYNQMILFDSVFEHTPNVANVGVKEENANGSRISYQSEIGTFTVPTGVPFIRR